MEVKFYVYKLISKGIPFYIGKGKKTETYDRVEYHLKYWEHSKNKKLFNKIKKLNNIFDIEIIFESQNEQECLDLEVKLIKEIGRENLCNLTNGGEGISGFNHSEETKQKISIWRKGRSLSEETCRKITQNKIGKAYKLNNIPEGKIEKLYETKSIHEISSELKLAFTTIKKYLVEKNLYIPYKNKKVKDSTKNKMSNIMKNKFNKPILQFDKQNNFIKEYSSLTEACNHINKPGRMGDITSCCKGNQKTAFGFIWKYKKY